MKYQQGKIKQEHHYVKEFEQDLKSIEKIEEHVERARKITHNMLGFARRMEPRLDDVDVNTIIDQTLELLKNHARINNIEIRNSIIHETADGRRYLVLHGDKFDPVVQHSPWLASIGSTAYEILLVCNRWFNIGRRSVGKDYRSLSAWIKHQVKIAVNYMSRFEDVVVQEGLTNDVDGLICGHIHEAGIREIENLLYTNSGDWVESCTALAENHAGRLGIIEWRNQQPQEATLAVKTYEDLYRNRCLASPN